MTKRAKKPRKPLNALLDLDNTCIHSIDTHKFPKRKSVLHTKPHYFMDNDYVIFERPGLQEFLDYLFENFNVSVWSAASPKYVEYIVENVIMRDGRELEYVLTSDNCEDCQDYYGEDHFKNLKYLWDIHDLHGFGPLNTLIIDDLGLVRKANPNNSIQIKSFSVNHKQCWDDNELLDRIRPALEEIRKNFESKVEQDGFLLIEF